MNRKWTATVWISTLALSVLLVGCPKKKPELPAPMEMETKTEAPQPTDIDDGGTVGPVTDTGPIYDSDIVAAQRNAEAGGLLGDVFFDFDRYELKESARARLAKNASFMKAHPEYSYAVEGHCDERGTNEYNLALGDRRANAARGYVTSLGVNGNRMRSISYGEERPGCTTSSEGCWSRNRRAHFQITGYSE